MYLGFLDVNGDLIGGFTQVSDSTAAYSRYPDAAFAPWLDTAGRIAIVWSDERNTATSHDVYSAVWDLATDAVVDSSGVNHPVTNISDDEFWPVVTATPTGFLTAVIATLTEQVVTVELDAAGLALAAPFYVTPEGTASRPVDVAYDGVDGVGLVWRDDRFPTQKRIMFRPLDVDGTFAGELSDGTAVGDGLRYVTPSEFPSYYLGEAVLEFDAVAGAYVLAWDAQPGVSGGEPSLAEIFVTRVAPDGGSYDAPYQLSTAVGRSVLPALAVGDAYLAAWHDNRATPTDLTFTGEIYAAGLSCP